MTRAPAVLALTLAATLLVGCSGDDTDPPDEAPPTTSAAGAPETPVVPELETRATIRKVTGDKMTKAARTKLRDKITTAVDEWFDAAYLDGDYPRTDFDDAFAVFTDGARERAEDDRVLMSNAGVGTTTYAVRATVRRLRIDVLSADGRGAAATVLFKLGIAREGEAGNEVAERVTGHLFMTYSGDGWRVFGYDVKRGVV